MFRSFSLIVTMIFFVSGCVSTYEVTTDSPRKRALYRNRVQSVVCLPFLEPPTGEGDISTVSDIFVSELTRFSEIKVIPLSSVSRYLQEHDIELSKVNIRDVAYAIGDFFGVDAVIIGSVIEYDAFYPPVFGLALEVIGTDGRQTIAHHSQTFDASYTYVRDAVEAYMSVKTKRDSLYEEEYVLRRFDEYIRFVCFRMIDQYL